MRAAEVYGFKLADLADPANEGECLIEHPTFTLPVEYQVCSRCRGNGTHVNPAIDGNGLTRVDFDEQGPEFFEDYMSGVYDVPCHQCKGKRVVLVVDHYNLNADDRRLYNCLGQAIQDENEYAAEVAAERRMGA